MSHRELGRSFIVTPPAIEPITLEQAKDHVRSDVTTDAAELSQWIRDARESVEDQFINRALITQTIDYKLDAFPWRSARIIMARPPLQSVTSITYTASDGSTVVMPSGDYVVSNAGHKKAAGRIRPAVGVTWPGTQDVDDAVIVRAVVGYGAGWADIPAPIVSAMLIIIGDRYDNRSAIVIGTIAGAVPQTARDLLEDYRFSHPAGGGI